MTRQKMIVVGVDGGPDGLRAAEFAARMAQTHGGGVRLVHAYHAIVGLNPMFPLYRVEDLHEFGQQSIRAAAQRVTDLAPDVQIDEVLVNNSSSVALVNASRSASMVVVGRRHIHGVERVLSGSTSSAVAARAKAPVVSVPGSWTPSTDNEPHRIVVGADGSSQGRDALAFAFAEASRRGAPLMVVRVWDLPMRWYADVPPLDSELREWLDAARLALAEDLAGWSETYPDVVVSRVIERSPYASRVLVNRGHGAGLLVIGSRGHGGLPGLDLGWTARSVLAHADAPVAIVHRGDAAAFGNVLVPASVAQQ